MSITLEFTGRPQLAISNILGEGGVNLVSLHGLVMNRTKLPHIISWSGNQNQIHMHMFMLASISISVPTKEFPTMLLLHAVRSLINDAPQMAIQRAFVRPREILLIFQCCLLGHLGGAASKVFRVIASVCTDWAFVSTRASSMFVKFKPSSALFSMFTNSRRPLPKLSLMLCLSEVVQLTSAYSGWQWPHSARPRMCNSY